MKIVTHHGRPPIPDRSHDWCATTDDYEPGHLIGNGATKEAAVADLRAQLDEIDEARAAECKEDARREADEYTTSNAIEWG